MTQTARAPLSWGITLPPGDEHAIYAIIHPVELHALYVGLTSNIEQRHLHHFTHKPWIREMIEEGIEPVMILLETDIRGAVLARKYEAYWIQELLSQGHPLYNVAGNSQGVIKIRHFMDSFLHLPKEEQRRVLRVNTHGIAFYGLRYGRIFEGLYLRESNRCLNIDVVKHWVAFAEAVCKLCEIPMAWEETAQEQAAVKRLHTFMVEKGMSRDEALDALEEVER